MLKKTLILAFGLFLTSAFTVAFAEECEFDLSIASIEVLHSGSMREFSDNDGYWESMDDAPPEVVNFGRSVGRIQLSFKNLANEVRMTSCTGTLISQDEILTARHCYFPADHGRKDFRGYSLDSAMFDLGFLSTADTSDAISLPLFDRPEASDKNLDAMVLKIKRGNPADFGFQPIERIYSEQDGVNASLYIVHHPGGQPQRFSETGCRISQHHNSPTRPADAIRHRCSTIGGSSGSLVLDRRTMLPIGVHFRGEEFGADSFNEAHKIRLISQSLGLGFELASNDNQSSPQRQDQLAQTEMLAVFLERDKSRQLELARAFFRDYGSSPEANQIRLLVGDLESDLAEERARADYDSAISRNPISSRISALQAVARNHQNTEFGRLASSDATRLEREQQELAAARREAQAVSNAPTLSSPHLAPGDTFSDCDDCPEMVVIPAGSFMMGSPSNEPGRSDNEGPQKRVTISDSFAMGKYEVTFNQWTACVRGGKCRSNRFPDDQGWGRGNRPVINVSWNDAHEYVRWLNVQVTGNPYRLPSESEWEYAARAGTTTAFHTGSRITTGRANFDGTNTYNGSLKGTYKQETIPVGSHGSNQFGLHDMH